MYYTNFYKQLCYTDPNQCHALPPGSAPDSSEQYAKLKQIECYLNQNAASFIDQQLVGMQILVQGFLFLLCNEPRIKEAHNILIKTTQLRDEHSTVSRGFCKLTVYDQREDSDKYFSVPENWRYYFLHPADCTTKKVLRTQHDASYHIQTSKGGSATDVTTAEEAFGYLTSDEIKSFTGAFETIQAKGTSNDLLQVINDEFNANFGDGKCTDERIGVFRNKAKQLSAVLPYIDNIFRDYLRDYQHCENYQDYLSLLTQYQGQQVLQSNEHGRDTPITFTKAVFENYLKNTLCLEFTPTTTEEISSLQSIISATAQDSVQNAQEEYTTGGASATPPSGATAIPILYSRNRRPSTLPSQQQRQKSCLIPVCIEFKRNSQYISAAEQAKKILTIADRLVAQGVNKVGLIYSANDQQTRTINSTYGSGEWKTNICGANQAAVVKATEDLLATASYQHLQRKFIIQPITTTYYSSKPSEEQKKQYILTDLARIEDTLSCQDDSVCTLGWQNQEGQSKFAIGGGCTTLSQLLDNLIQNRLHSLAGRYQPSENLANCCHDTSRNAPTPKVPSHSSVRKLAQSAAEIALSRFITESQLNSDPKQVAVGIFHRMNKLDPTNSNDLHILDKILSEHSALLLQYFHQNHLSNLAILTKVTEKLFALYQEELNDRKVKGVICITKFWRLNFGYTTSQKQEAVDVLKRNLTQNSRSSKDLVNLKKLYPALGNARLGKLCDALGTTLNTETQDSSTSQNAANRRL